MKAQITRIHDTYLVLVVRADDETTSATLLFITAVLCLGAAGLVLAAIVILRAHVAGEFIPRAVR